MGRKGRYNPGFLADDERRRESRRTAEMVHSITKGDEHARKKTLRVAVTNGQGACGHTQPCGSQQVDASSNQEVTAYTGTGFKLDHWEDNGQKAGKTNPLMVQMNGIDHTVYAHFAPTSQAPTDAHKLDSKIVARAHTGV